jgi:hypothetical protein
VSADQSVPAASPAHRIGRECQARDLYIGQEARSGFSFSVHVQTGKHSYCLEFMVGYRLNRVADDA